MPRRRPRGERGETLIEVTMSVLILSIAVVALVGGLVTAVMMSDVHRKQAKAGTFLRAFGEAVQTSVAGGGYKPCGLPADYQPLAAPVMTDPLYQATVVSVAYWNGTAFGAACTAATDTGVQQLTLRVITNPAVDKRVVENLQIVIRKPCKPGDACT